MDDNDFKLSDEEDELLSGCLMALVGLIGCILLVALIVYFIMMIAPAIIGLWIGLSLLCGGGNPDDSYDYNYMDRYY